MSINLPIPKDDFLRKAALSQLPKNQDEFLCLMVALGLRPAVRPTHPDHSTPTLMVLDLYFARETNALVVGSRASGKTQGLSLLELLLARSHNGLSIVHVGAVEKQAKIAYGYVQEYLQDEHLKQETLKTIQSETIWKNGSRLQILPGTMNAVSGPHPQVAVADEADQLDWEVYQQFLGMPHSMPGFPARVIITSAIYYQNGVMNKLIKDASRTGTKTYLWDVFDTMEPCDGRQGRPACEDARLARQGISASPSHCAMWQTCKGRAQYATGHNSREDILRNFLRADSDTWQSQYMSQGVTRKGLVFPNFSQVPETGNVSIKAEYNPDLALYYGVDYGWTDPTVILLIQPQRDGSVFVIDELYVTHKLIEESLGLVGVNQGWFLQDLANKDTRGPYKAPEGVFIDSSAKEMQEQFARRGLRVIPSTAKITDGIAIMRSRFLDAREKRDIIIHPRCENLIQELSAYSLKQLAPGVYGDEPASNNGNNNPDHAIDALRYYFQGRMLDTELSYTSISRFSGVNPYRNLSL